MHIGDRSCDITLRSVKNSTAKNTDLVPTCSQLICDQHVLRFGFSHVWFDYRPTCTLVLLLQGRTSGRGRARLSSTRRSATSSSTTSRSCWRAACPGCSPNRSESSPPTENRYTHAHSLAQQTHTPLARTHTHTHTHTHCTRARKINVVECWC